MSFESSITRYAHSNGYTIVSFTEEEGTFVSAGSDGDIRVWRGIEDPDPQTGCTGEFIASLAFYDNRVYVGTDLNTVQMLSFPDLERDGTTYRFTAFATAIKVNAKYVASGSEDTTVKVYDNETSKVTDLTGNKGPILGIDLSSDGILATSSGDGTIKVWDIKDEKIIKTIDGLYQCKSFEMADRYVTPSFSGDHNKYLAYPEEKEILILDTNNWSVVKSLKNGDVKGDYTVCAFSKCGKFLAAGSSVGEISIWDVETESIIKGRLQEDNKQPITSLDWNPQSDISQFVYADKSGQIGCIDINHGKKIKKATAEVTAEDGMDLNLLVDDMDDDNDNCVSLEKLKNETMRSAGLDPEGNYLESDDDDEIKSVRTDIVPVKSSAPSLKLCTAQSAFQPSSTPDHLEHRYLIWNDIGIVRSHKSDSENSIEAEFHDASMHHGIHMSNFLNHTMASLSSSVLALAGGDQNKLVCIALGAGSREWSAVLPNCEEILVVTASTKLVAVGTDARFIRIFSYMGNQREVLSLPGPVVAMASFENKLMAVYHSGISQDEQILSCQLFEAFGLGLKCRDIRLPITPSSKLNWVGYSDRGSPVSFDSFGMLRILRGNTWIPVCDTTLHTKGASDNFFIVGVSEHKQIVRAVLCRGTSFPLTNPRPMVMELPMRLPLCEIETDKSQWEDELIRHHSFNVEEGETRVREVALKLFALACRSEIEMRARDLIEMIGSSALIPLTAKYANKLGRIHLSEKLSEMLPSVMEMEKEKEKDKYQDEEVELFTDSQPIQFQSPVATPRVTIETPVIAPKLIKPNSGKRNPFKKNFQTTPKSSLNPIKHLVDEIVGLPSNESNIPSDSLDKAEKVQDSTAKTKSPARVSFYDWYSEHKTSIMSELPDNVTPSELTSYAMKKFKQLGKSDVESPGTKRKLEEKENDSGSGIAKLAKFKHGV